MALLLIAGVIFGFIYLMKAFPFLYKLIGIKTKLNIMMVNDNAGTQLISLLGAQSGKVRNIELMGSYSAEEMDEDTAYTEPLKKTLDAAYQRYDLTVPGIGLNLRNGVPPAIQDNTQSAIPSCGTSALPNDAINLVWPIADSRTINSGFGGRVMGGGCNCHSGIDIAANGKEVLAAADGVVSVAGYESGGAGNYVRILHKFGNIQIYSYYMHLKEIKTSVGKTVKAGELIGISGDTGKSTGPHLHFELRYAVPQASNKDAIDPCTLFSKDDQAKMAGYCEHQGVAACSYVTSGNGIQVHEYQAEIPLPGPFQGSKSLRSQVIFKQWV